MNTYYVGGYPVTDELYHHGILGIHWGVRRYQNLDGTLTPAGKERYAKNIGDVSDGKLYRQMMRSGNSLSHLGKEGWKKYQKSMEEEHRINREFVRNAMPYADRWDYGTARKMGEQYLRDIAKKRLTEMGYEPNETNVEILAGKKWFRNSTWISNTLAAIGVKDVDYRPEDDVRYR